MHASIILKESKVKLVIPIKWIESLDIVQVMNIGIRHTKDHVIFYSSNESIEADFTAQMRTVFDETAPARYIGKVLSIWGKTNLLFCKKASLLSSI